MRDTVWSIYFGASVMHRGNERVQREVPAEIGGALNVLNQW